MSFSIGDTVSSLLPDTFRTRSLEECLKLIGVDSIGHLKRNSIQELCRLHECVSVLLLSCLAIGRDDEWRKLAFQNNCLLEYVVVSQFVNVLC